MAYVKPPPTKKKLPVGVDNFEKLLSNDYYYVDKTNLIAEILDEAAEVTLFTRPRRFGKTLNMTMLRTFFEVGRDGTLFDGLAISKREDLCEKYMNKFPVVFLTLKGVDGLNFESAFNRFRYIVATEIKRHNYLLDSSNLSEEEKQTYKMLKNSNFSEVSFSESVGALCTLLEKHYDSKVVLLIDEYDVPLDKAYVNGYYDEMIDVIRSMFGAALKSNESLQMAVLTGCLRVSKESIFTGLNNMRVCTVSDSMASSSFGFTSDEVKKMLDYYEVSDRFKDAQAWYDGYLFGEDEMFCPWDVINFSCDLRRRPNARPTPYWINSSGNDIVRRLIKNTNNISVQHEIEILIEGGTISKQINENITHREIDRDIENIWSLLYMTGYLTTTEIPDTDVYSLRIPNFEITQIYEQQVLQWFRDCVRDEAKTNNESLEELYVAFENGDATAIEEQLNERLLTTVSYFDAHENFYHGFLLALLSTCNIWYVQSNLESGNGRGDIFVENARGTVGIAIEIKYTHDPDDLAEACKDAMSQINNKNYTANFKRKNLKRILKMGISFCGKESKVLVEKG